MRIDPATPADLAVIREAYAEGRRLQRAQGAVSWPQFTDAWILGEMADGRLFRVVDGAQVAGVFSIALDDSAIWGDHERGAHIYLHRIARTPTYGGRGIVDAIVEWARGECRTRGREGLRMDTWASNDALIAYYARFGFRLVERRRIAPDPSLLPHYHGLELALLECAVGVSRASATSPTSPTLETPLPVRGDPGDRRFRAYEHAGMSILVPGLGQLAQRRFGAAIIQFGTVATYLGIASYLGGGRTLLVALCWNVWSVLDAYGHDHD